MLKYSDLSDQERAALDEKARKRAASQQKRDCERAKMLSQLNAAQRRFDARFRNEKHVP